MTLFDGAIQRTDFTSIIEKHLGHSGRMIAMSKSRYREYNPKGFPYFNACIYDSELKQIWYGDIDLNLDNKKLKAIAKESKQIFYVTPEHPFRSDFHKVTQEDLNNPDNHAIKFGDKK